MKGQVRTDCETESIFLAGLALISLLLAGCKVNIVTTVDPAGKGNLQTEIVFTAEEVQSLTSLSGGSTENICNSLQTPNSLSGATFTQETRGNETYCITTQPFASLDELTNLYGQMDGVTINELSLENGRLVYNVDVNLSGDEVGGMFSPSLEW